MATTPEIVVIAAVAEDGTIGDDGTMPWHHAEDLRRFKATTMGAPVIMGRRTYESIVAGLGSALPGRHTIVLSRRDPEQVRDPEHVPDDETAVEVAGSLEDAFDRAAATGADTVYVAGGASVYEQVLPRADRLLITEVPGRFDGDARFPPIAAERWRERDREDVDALAFVEYVRR